MVYPSELIGYFSSLFNSKKRRYLGHNPASSYAAIVMFIFNIGLGVIGILMSKGVYKDFFEEIHELCANGFMITVILHITGVAFHQKRHKDGIITSMFNGRKNIVHNIQGIKSNHKLIAVTFVGLVISFAIYLNRNYDFGTQKLNLLSTQIEFSVDDYEYPDKDEHEHDD